MTAPEIIAEVRMTGGDIEADGTDLVLSAPSPLPPDLMDRVRKYKPELLAVLTHPDLLDLSDEFRRTGRIRIETVAGDAWLVESYDSGDDIEKGGVYSVETWPYFVALSSEEKLLVHRFLCGLGGGRFQGSRKRQ